MTRQQKRGKYDARYLEISNLPLVPSAFALQALQFQLKLRLECKKCLRGSEPALKVADKLSIGGSFGLEYTQLYPQFGGIVRSRCGAGRELLCSDISVCL